MNIPLFRIYWDDDDVRSVTKIIQQGSDWASGPKIDEFEKTISGLKQNLEKLKKKLKENMKKFGKDMSKWPLDKAA